MRAKAYIQSVWVSGVKGSADVHERLLRNDAETRRATETGGTMEFLLVAIKSRQTVWSVGQAWQGT